MVSGTSYGVKMTFLVDSRTEQFQIERASIAGIVEELKELRPGNGTVAWYGAAGQAAVAEDIVADLDKDAARQGTADEIVQPGFRPAGKHVDADADAGKFRERDGVAQIVGEMGVGM